MSRYEDDQKLYDDEPLLLIVLFSYNALQSRTLRNYVKSLSLNGQ